MYMTKKRPPSCMNQAYQRLITIDPTDTVNPDQDIKPISSTSYQGAGGVKVLGGPGDKCQHVQPFWQIMWLNYYAPPPHPLQRL